MKIKRFNTINESNKNDLSLVVCLPPKSDGLQYIVENTSYAIFTNNDDAENYILDCINYDLEDIEDMVNDKQFMSDLLKGYHLVNVEGSTIFTHYDEAIRWASNYSGTWTYLIEDIILKDNFVVSDKVTNALKEEKYNL